MVKLPEFDTGRVPQQVPRLVAVFALVVVALVVARTALIPDTFGERGHYRAAAVDSIVAHEKKYAGQQECALCHNAIMQARLAGNHSGLGCESCHGPAASHTANPVEFKPRIPQEREFCLRCHQYNPSRPTGFPQIDPISHNAPRACFTCHDPHAPVPPVAPGSCAACHGQISYQKGVSHHAALECTTCHEAPEEHKLSPRLVRPSKPTDRSFCGACHAEGADSPREIPRISLRTHNPQYVCWQCHYPHYPEAS
ncbi:MAG: cytochrome c3 family protein [Gemmatimonadota bacterium]|nr:MAG: cytochrome c3 family protein [Gemmatimonadota bacterium]